jgi:hypothetical protein
LITASIILFNGCQNPTPPKTVEIQKDNIVAMQENFDLYIRDSFKKTDKFINKTEKRILLLNKNNNKINPFIYYK